MLILTVLNGPDRGKRFVLPDDEPQLIGRSSEALPLTDQTISRRHSELTPDDGRWYINDLHSSNGTYVNGRRVNQRMLLQLGDEIRVGNTLFIFGYEKRDTGVRIAAANEMDVHIENEVKANDESMIMAVPDPSAAASFNLNVIYKLLELIGSTTERAELLEKVLDLIFEFCQADRGFILMQDDATGEMKGEVVRHRRPPTSAEDRQITVSRTIVEYVVNRRQGVLTSNAMNDLRFSTGDSVQRYAIRSAICVPIIFKDQLFGVINLDSKVINYTYTEDQLHLLTAIGVQTGLALSNMRLYAERLERERLAAVGQTVASLSHSVKNIIQGLTGGAEVVELGLRKTNLAVVKNGWKIVTRNLERISQLTMNMLAFSKQRKPELEMVNLNSLLQEVVQLVQKQYDDKKAALLTALDEDMPPVPVDAAGIHQAVLNLLNNALDAVAAETGAVTLSSQFTDDGRMVQIVVGDNGVGIEPEYRQKVFLPFYSTKGLKGTGLGLAVSRKIVEEHGGTIEVDTSHEQGTTFIISLPTTVEEMPQSADTAGPGGGARDEEA
ncbi:MAG: FHA domain-containing protein [Phycisphaeraceae bacterium]|nr:FHA domain-containing protein [Phycisphaeraceae bacterium]